MKRALAFAAIFALAAPTFAAAQEHREEHHPPPKPAVRPVIPPRGPIVPSVGPRVVGPAAHPYVFHGHPIHPVHFAHPFVYPPGWAYRRWVVGAVLPALFLAPAYYYADWAAVGLSPPPPGYEWVQYGPDLLLVNVATGQVVDVAYGVFY